MSARFVSCILLGSIAVILGLMSVSSIAQDVSPMLVLDSRRGAGMELPNFRRMSDPFLRQSSTIPSREGLSALKSSGSGQFSEEGLKLLKERVPSEEIVIVDLRQESHGFMNGLAVSWRGEHNWANLGRDLQAVEADERERLKAALTGGEVTALMLEDDDRGKEVKTPLHLEVERVCTEKELCDMAGVGYVRLVVPDHRRPDDAIVDEFVDLVKSHPGAWLHFHCRAGKGRTGTFLAMYDMMSNAGKVSLEDILRRQYLFGGSELLDPPSPDSWKHPYALARTAFLQKFYDYCAENRATFGVSWSQWCAAKPVQQRN